MPDKDGISRKKKKSPPQIMLESILLYLFLLEIKKKY